jgi:hypothetical protein
MKASETGNQETAEERDELRAMVKRDREIAQAWFDHRKPRQYEPAIRNPNGREAIFTDSRPFT